MALSATFTRALLDGFGDAYPQLLRIAGRSARSRDEARDLVHDAWLRLAEHERAGAPAAGDAGRPGGEAATAAALPHDVTAYLAAVARHLALDDHRQRQLLAQHVNEATLHAQLAPAQAPDAADHVMYRQALAVVDRVLAGLPARPRAAFVAHRLHGEKQPAIAARLGVSLNTVERDLIQASACIEDALHRWRGTPPAGAQPAGRRRSLSALLGLAGLGCGLPLLWTQWQRYRDEQVQWQAALDSPRAEQRRYTLPDGSDLQLDALSRVELRFHAARRSAHLAQGAAFFAVARDEARPFSVQADDVRVTVLGTRFGVELLPGDGTGQALRAVLVQVESGSVRVDPGAGAAPQLLGAGQALRVLPGGRSERESLGATAASWRNGELAFVATPLGEALARLARYTDVPLQASTAAADLPVSGRLRITRARAWVEALPQVLPVRLRPLAGGGLRVERRAG